MSAFDPLSDPAMRQFQTEMAETDVKMYTGFLKSANRWQRWDNAFFVWFIAFSIFETVLFVYYLVHWRIWALSSGGLAVLNVFLARLNRRTRRTRQQTNANWEQKRVEALHRLQSLDPDNALVPYVIEETP